MIVRYRQTPPQSVLRQCTAIANKALRGEQKEEQSPCIYLSTQCFCPHEIRIAPIYHDQENEYNATRKKIIGASKNLLTRISFLHTKY